MTRKQRLARIAANLETAHNAIKRGYKQAQEIERLGEGEIRNELDLLDSLKTILCEIRTAENRRDLLELDPGTHKRRR